MSLPLITSCDSCGACCCRTPIPPFQPGEEVERDVPQPLLAPIHERIRLDQHFDLLPCVWYDASIRRCQHYEFRPAACRQFEIAGDLCRLSRWDEGIDR